MVKKKILVTGANGLLGQKIIYNLKKRKDVTLIACSRGINRLIETKGYKYIELDITNKNQIQKLISLEKPDAVINCAAMTNVDKCENNKKECWEINVNAVENIATSCELINAHVLHLSTDFVFDGIAGPYNENDQPNPLHFYAESKLKSEEIIQKTLSNWSIARTIIIYGITDNMSRSNIVLWAKSEIGKGNTINVVKDQYRSPTFAEDLAKGCISIIDKSALGLYHLSGPKTYSILDLVYQVADFYNLDKSLINPVTSASLKQPAKRPLVTGFDISKAKRDLDYNPVDFGEGTKIMHQQIKKYEV